MTSRQVDKILNFQVIVEQDEDGVFVASVPAVPGCFSQGKTYEEAVNNIKEALELALDVAEDIKEYGKQINYPSEKGQPTFIGVVNLPIKLA